MNNGNIDALVYLAGVYIIAFVNPKDAFEVTQNFFNLIYANENRKLWTLYISNASIRTDPPQVQYCPPIRARRTKGKAQTNDETGSSRIELVRRLFELYFFGYAKGCFAF